MKKKLSVFAITMLSGFMFAGAQGGAFAHGVDIPQPEETPYELCKRTCKGACLLNGRCLQIMY